MTKKQNVKVNEQNLARESLCIYSLYPLSPRFLNAEFCFRLSLMLISKPNIGSQLTCKKVGLFIFPTFLLCFASHLDPALALSKNFFWHSLMVQHNHIEPRAKSSFLRDQWQGMPRWVRQAMQMKHSMTNCCLSSI